MQNWRTRLSINAINRRYFINTDVSHHKSTRMFKALNLRSQKIAKKPDTNTNDISLTKFKLKYLN